MRNARKRSLCHVRAKKVQIRLRVCAVWSGPSLPAYSTLGYCGLYQQAESILIILRACAGWSGPWMFGYGRKSLLPRLASYDNPGIKIGGTFAYTRGACFVIFARKKHILCAHKNRPGPKILTTTNIKGYGANKWQQTLSAALNFVHIWIFSHSLYSSYILLLIFVKRKQVCRQDNQLRLSEMDALSEGDNSDKLFWKGATPIGSKFFSYRVDPVSEGA